MNATMIAAKITAQQPHFGGTVWTMRDGTQVDVADMTPAHAANALAMLVRSTRRMLASLVTLEMFDTPPSDREDVQAEAERRFEELCAITADDVMAATTLGAALYARAAEAEG